MPDVLDNRWRIGYMPYLNSAPFYARLEGDWFDLVELPPRNMAAAMQQGEIDAGPLPIAEVIRMRGAVVEGGLGVAVNGRARSVLLFSNCPVEELTGRSVAVTSHTSTSVQLLRILFADHWGIEGVDLRGPDEACDAELLIGDDALKKVYTSEGSPFVYDLASEWKQMTGMPFVFARWVARGDATKPELGRFAETLHGSFAFGMSHLRKVVRRASIPGMSSEECVDYLKAFTYELGDAEFAAIEEFESRMAKLSDWRPDVMPY